MPTRQQLERGFAKRLGTLSAKHKKQLMKLLGDPPDIANVPEEFWARVERETEQETAVALLAIMLSTGTSFAASRKKKITPTERLALRQRFEQAAKERARKLSGGVINNAKRRLTVASASWADRTSRGLDLVDVDQRTTSIFGPKRAATIARTETTGAKFDGEETVAREIIGDEMVAAWVLGPCRHCEFCPLIAGTGREFWSQFVSKPPAHVHCCCRVLFGPPGTRTKPPPPVNAVRNAMKLSGVFGF